MEVPETAAELKTLAELLEEEVSELPDDESSELLDDDPSESAEDGSAAATATGTWEGKTVAVADTAEEEDFGFFPAGQAAAET